MRVLWKTPVDLASWKVGLGSGVVGGLGFRIHQGSGLEATMIRGWCLGVGVQFLGFWFRVKIMGLSIRCFGFGVQGLGLRV